MTNWSELIIPNGTKVVIKATGVKGHTVAFCIYGNNEPRISYRVIWWSGGERKDDWLDDFEIERYVDTSKKPGMVNYEDNPDKLLT